MIFQTEQKKINVKLLHLPTPSAHPLICTITILIMADCLPARGATTADLQIRPGECKQPKPW